MIGIINCGSEFIDDIQRCIALTGKYASLTPMNNLRNWQPNSYNGIVISGAPILLTEVDANELVQRFDFVKNLTIPLLGICFGHQILGLLYRSRIEIGDLIDYNETIELVHRGKLFKDIPDGSNFREAHKESVSVPQGFTLLARSSSCENEAMESVEGEKFGVQFHPEASGRPGMKIFENFLALCKS
jgi:GMP synthase (glutamine-hydrolysing)